MREGELFNLRWHPVDFFPGKRGAIRVEEQQRTRLVGGKPWKPKHLEFRVVPLTQLARSIIARFRQQVPHAPDDLVIANRGGAPYVRLENAPAGSGKGWWYEILEQCGLHGRVRFHDLRHVFPVRCLQHGVQIAAVSAWLGHSGVSFTVKRYGRWSQEALEQLDWIDKIGQPKDAVAKGLWPAVHGGGRPST